MPMIPSIPCPPGEDYDHAHSTASSLASLSAMVASFDAIMDSLEESTKDYSTRIDALIQRCEQSGRMIQTMQELGKQGHALQIRSPARFPLVQKGGGGNLKWMPRNTLSEDDLVKTSSSGAAGADGTAGGYYDVVSHGKEPTIDGTSKKQYLRVSPLDKARRASNDAVLKVLQDDWQTDDGLASPSDVWLDRGSGFDEGNLCRSAEQVHTVPSLTHNMKMEELEIIHEQTSQKTSGKIGSLPHTETDDYDTVAATSANTNLLDEHGDVFDETKTNSMANDVFEQYHNATFSSASSAWNTAASQNQNHIMDLHEDDTSIITSSTIFTNTPSQRKMTTSQHPYPTATRQFQVQDVDSSTPRLHAATGSQPFLCELLHDSYGVGNEPPKSDPGSYFSSVQTVAELLYFNSDQECYKKSTSTSDDGIDEHDAYGTASTTNNTNTNNTNTNNNNNNNWKAASNSTKKHSLASSIKSLDRKVTPSKTTSTHNTIRPILESMQIDQTPSISSNSAAIALSPNVFSTDTTTIPIPKLLDTTKLEHEPELEEEGITLKEQIRLFSPNSTNANTISSPNIENFQPSDSKVNANPLRLPDNLPLDAVVSAFQKNSIS